MKKCFCLLMTAVFILLAVPGTCDGCEHAYVWAGPTNEIVLKTIPIISAQPIRTVRTIGRCIYCLGTVNILLPVYTDAELLAMGCDISSGIEEHSAQHACESPLYCDDLGSAEASGAEPNPICIYCGYRIGMPTAGTKAPMNGDAHTLEEYVQMGYIPLKYAN